MTTKPEQSVAELQQKNLTAAMKLAQISIENAQRIMQMQVDITREIFDDGVENAKALAQAQTPQQQLETRTRYAQQAAEKMFECSRAIAGLTADMQAEMGKMLSDQISCNGQEIVDAMENMLQGMPLNNHAAAEALQHTFDGARKSIEQVTKASSEAFAAFAQMSGKRR